MESEKILRQLGELGGLRKVVNFHFDHIYIRELKDTFVSILDICIGESGEGLEEVADFLFQSNIDLKAWGFEVMRMSCRLGNLDLIIRLMDAGYPLDEGFYHDAIEYKQEEVIIFFLKKGIPLDQTRLHYIFKYGLLKVVETLIELKQNLEDIDMYCFQIACQYSHIELIKLLLSKPELPIDLSKIELGNLYCREKDENEIRDLIKAEIYRRRALVKSANKKS